VLSCVDRDLHQHILATPLGTIILVIEAIEFFYPSPVLMDLLFWFALVIASSLFRPIAKNNCGITSDCSGRLHSTLLAATYQRSKEKAKCWLLIAWIIKYIWIY